MTSHDPASSQRRVLRKVLLAFFLSGCAALIYEVVWTRALSLVLGSTVYALSTMLSTFMGGLALGSYFGGKLADRVERPLAWFGAFELGIAISGLASLPLIYLLPAAYLHLYSSLHLMPPLFFSAQILLCALVMLVPTTLMGATFPLVARSITHDLRELGEKVGEAYSFNTIGAVVGSLSVGFLLIPHLGMRGAIAVAAALNLLVSIVLFIEVRHVKKRLAVPALFLLACAGTWTARAEQDITLLSFYSVHRVAGMESYSSYLDRENLADQEVFYGEYAEGTVRAFLEPSGHLLLQVGAKVEGTGAIDVPNTLLLAYLPLASVEHPESFLNIGLGAGVTLKAARDLVPEVTLVEIHPGVLEAVSRFGEKDLLKDLPIELTDARNFLLRDQRQWDVISSEPSYPTESTVGNLFTLDFYRIAAERLTEGGVFCQWLPYYILQNDDVTMMVKTFASVFPETTLWKIPGSLDLILVGSKTEQPFTPDQIHERVFDLHQSRGGQPALEFFLSRNPEQIREIVGRQDVPLNTDDHPILEFRAANNLLLGNLALEETPEP